MRETSRPMSTKKNEPKKDLSTLAIRAGQRRKDAFDAVTTPIACTATYAFSTYTELRDQLDATAHALEACIATIAPSLGGVEALVGGARRARDRRRARASRRRDRGSGGHRGGGPCRVTHG